MKHFIAFGVSVLLVGSIGLGMAQTSPKTPTASGRPVGNSAVHSFNLRLREDMVKLSQDMHKGTLTPAQVKNLRAQILAIRKQELSNLRSNGHTHGKGQNLTATQETQLGQQLNQIESQL